MLRFLVHQRPRTRGFTLVRRSIIPRLAMLVWSWSASDAMLDIACLHLLFWAGMSRLGRHEDLCEVSHSQQDGTSDILNRDCDASQQCIIRQILKTEYACRRHSKPKNQMRSRSKPLLTSEAESAPICSRSSEDGMDTDQEVDIMHVELSNPDAGSGTNAGTPQPRLRTWERIVEAESGDPLPRALWQLISFRTRRPNHLGL